MEGENVVNVILAEGFSYGSVPISVSTLSFSEFMEEGYILTDFFNSSDIPDNAADSTYAVCPENNLKSTHSVYMFFLFRVIKFNFTQ